MEITYRTDITPTAEQVIALYDNSGLTRPTKDAARIKKIYDNSNLIVTAWDGEKLVGISRCVTDWAWSCYLADLAVSHDYKKSGIGKRLIDLTKETVSDQTMVLLLSVATAMEYYPKVGFAKVENGFIMNRKI